MKEAIEFKPTKTWLRQHKYKPSQCRDDDCYCIFDHLNHLSHGFCAGILLNEVGDLDVISFCDITYDEDCKGNKEEGIRHLWHPSEALLITNALNAAVINVFGLMPDYRKQLGYLGRKRTRIIHKRDKGNGD